MNVRSQRVKASVSVSDRSTRASSSSTAPKHNTSSLPITRNPAFTIITALLQIRSTSAHRETYQNAARNVEAYLGASFGVDNVTTVVYGSVASGTIVAGRSDVNICCNFNDDYDNITGYCPNQRVDRLKYMEDRIRLVSENNLIDRLYSESIPSLKARIGCLTFHFTANWGKILGYALKFQEAKSTFPGYEDTFFLLEHILDSGGLIANEAGAGDISRFQLMAMLLSFFESHKEALNLHKAKASNKIVIEVVHFLGHSNFLKTTLGIGKDHLTRRHGSDAVFVPAFVPSEDGSLSPANLAKSITASGLARLRDYLRGFEKKQIDNVLAAVRWRAVGVLTPKTVAARERISTFDQTQISPLLLASDASDKALDERPQDANPSVPRPSPARKRGYSDSIPPKPSLNHPIVTEPQTALVHSPKRQRLQNPSSSSSSNSQLASPLFTLPGGSPSVTTSSITGRTSTKSMHDLGSTNEPYSASRTPRQITSATIPIPHYADNDGPTDRSIGLFPLSYVSDTFASALVSPAIAVEPFSAGTSAGPSTSRILPEGRYFVITYDDIVKLAYDLGDARAARVLAKTRHPSRYTEAEMEAEEAQEEKEVEHLIIPTEMRLVTE